MIENAILSGLIHNEEYTRKVIPFLKDEYFDDHNDRIIFNEIRSYIDKYNGLPTKDALLIAMGESDRLSEEQFKTIVDSVNDFSYDEKTDLDWIVDKTE